MIKKYNKLVLGLFSTPILIPVIAASCNNSNENNKLDSSKENNVIKQNSKDASNNTQESGDVSKENNVIKEDSKDASNNTQENKNSSSDNTDEEDSKNLFVFKEVIEDKPINKYSDEKIDNPKKLFDENFFPDNYELKGTEHNKNITQKYFSSEMFKSLKISVDNFWTGEIPKWMKRKNYIETDNLFSIIPDLSVYFTNNDGSITKHVRKVMPSFIGDNELEILNNKIIFKKNINNYLKQDFNNKKIKLYFKIQSNQIKDITKNYNVTSLIPIEIDIEDLMQTNRVNNYEFAQLENVDIPFDIKFKSLITKNGQLKVEIIIPNKKIVANNYKIDDSEVFIDKYGTLTDISYYVEKGKDKNFSITSKIYNNSPFAKLSSLSQLYDINSNSGTLMPGGKRIKKSEDRIFSKIRERVFSVGGGTMTMLAKVKPSDDNDLRYYFITNRHVTDILEKKWTDNRVNKKMVIWDFDDKKVASNSYDISLDINDSDLELNLWIAENQYDRKGHLENNETSNADISINIIDVKNLYDEALKTDNKNIIKYLENWKVLKPLKLSKYTNFINNDSFLKFRVASFPVSKNEEYFDRRYREHIINQPSQIILNEQLYENQKYGHFKSFTLQDDPIKSTDFDLVSGASGSMVFDENYDMVALFMQNIGDDTYGFGLLSSYKFDYLGYESNNNPNSFKNKLIELSNKYPEKYQLIDLS
ncbi:hypothetical protein [Mycoplasma zalophidermidis]|uniref:DUF31 domain-containing protein n=1 Tax=Mycoplasma zalophidermidis TaxID=398174 RepID=A0ABS6DQX6_9MOLU|nr:hypothetical protein [Mycoplasma zalophidermidis]MBU4689458.1 hypothetical protein [Mycoplasma zalophidermidis]MBU4693336.1 hypothetical protein [Mycoplasma zalophidermidis]MCR8966366.1 hypothetical protein [Mycoplasma zalophidermidis]